MTTLATDDFNRANSTTLGSNWTVIDPGWTVNNSTALCTTLAVISSIYTGVSFPNDQWCQATFASSGPITADTGIGPMVRSDTTNALVLFQTNAADSRVYLRSTSGVFTQLGVTGPGVVAGDVLYLQVIGTTAIAKINTSTVCGTLTSTAFPTGGKAGMFGALDGPAGVLDNWSAGDFGSGSVFDEDCRWYTVIQQY